MNKNFGNFMICWLCGEQFCIRIFWLRHQILDPFTNAVRFGKHFFSTTLSDFRRLHWEKSCMQLGDKWFFGTRCNILRQSAEYTSCASKKHLSLGCTINNSVTNCLRASYWTRDTTQTNHPQLKAKLNNFWLFTFSLFSLSLSPIV